jgi:hypothetical protein
LVDPLLGYLAQLEFVQCGGSGESWRSTAGVNAVCVGRFRAGLATPPVEVTDGHQRLDLCPGPDLALLRQVSFFRPMPFAIVDHLASELQSATCEPSDVIIRAEGFGERSTSSQRARHDHCRRCGRVGRGCVSGSISGSISGSVSGRGSGVQAARLFPRGSEWGGCRVAVMWNHLHLCGSGQLSGWWPGSAGAGRD